MAKLFNWFKSYLDYENMDELEESQEASQKHSEVKEASQTKTVERPLKRPSQDTAKQASLEKTTVKPEMERPTPAPSRPTVKETPTASVPERPTSQTTARRSSMQQATMQTGRPYQTQSQSVQHTAVNPTSTSSQLDSDGPIVIYPYRYEDVRNVVDHMRENRDVYVNFDHMLDSQARRCVDYLDGVSQALYGSFQKVGATNYLFTPARKTVQIIDYGRTAHQQQDVANYDYDMKRR